MGIDVHGGSIIAKIYSMVMGFFMLIIYVAMLRDYFLNCEDTAISTLLSFCIACLLVLMVYLCVFLLKKEIKDNTFYSKDNNYGDNYGFVQGDT